jgi:dihydroorotate dehydrogenase
MDFKISGGIDVVNTTFRRIKIDKKKISHRKNRILSGGMCG